MKVSSGPLFCRSVDQLERYMMNMVLEWRLAYATPYDFITLIMSSLAKETANYDSAAILSAATALSQLFFLCNLPDLLTFLAINKTAYKAPHNIALASLLGAVSLRGERELVAVFENLAGKDKEEVRSLVAYMHECMEDCQEATCSTACSPEPEPRILGTTEGFSQEGEVIMAGKRRMSEREICSTKEEEVGYGTKRFCGGKQ